MKPEVTVNQNDFDHRDKNEISFSAKLFTETFQLAFKSNHRTCFGEKEFHVMEPSVKFMNFV
jgi:hypothetical protein